VAREVIARLAETRQSIRDADRVDRRFVRLSALHTIAANFLAPRFEKMQEGNADLRTHVISDSLSACCDLLDACAVDILLCYFHAHVSPMIDQARFNRKDVAMDLLIPVAATTQAQQEDWRLSRTSGTPLPYLEYERSSFLGMVVEHTIGKKPFHAETIYIDGLVETIKRRVLRGSGFAWLPETAIAEELAKGLVVPVGADVWQAQLTISALADDTGLDATGCEVWAQL